MGLTLKVLQCNLVVDKCKQRGDIDTGEPPSKGRNMAASLTLVEDYVASADARVWPAEDALFPQEQRPSVRVGVRVGVRLRLGLGWRQGRVAY